MIDNLDTVHPAIKFQLTLPGPQINPFEALPPRGKNNPVFSPGPIGGENVEPLIGRQRGGMQKAGQGGRDVVLGYTSLGIAFVLMLQLRRQAGDNQGN